MSNSLWIPSFSQKPGPGASINWAHPLSRNLSHHWPLNEWNTAKITDIVKGVVLLPQTASTWSTGGLNIGSNSLGRWAGTTVAPANGSFMTVAIGFQIYGSGNWNQGDDFLQFCNCGMSMGSSGISGRYHGNPYQNTTPFAIPDRRVHTMVVTVGIRFALWMDGVLLYDIARPGTYQPLDNNIKFRNNSDSNQRTDLSLHFVSVYINREFTNEDALMLHLYPYGIFMN